MDIRSFYPRISDTLQGVVGFRLTRAAAQVIHDRFVQVLRDAVNQALTERPYLMSAASLRQLGVQLSDSIPDTAYVPCRPDPTNGMQLRIEGSYFVPSSAEPFARESAAGD